MNKHTFRVVQGAARFVFYMTASALILLSPVLAGLIVGGDVSA